MEIRKLLVLSTAHLSGATVAMLNTLPPMRWPVCGGSYADYGWQFYASEEDGTGNVPLDLMGIFEFARQNGCDNVLLDCDADEVDGLPVYDDWNHPQPGPLLPDGWFGWYGAGDDRIEEIVVDNLIDWRLRNGEIATSKFAGNGFWHHDTGSHGESGWDDIVAWRFTDPDLMPRIATAVEAVPVSIGSV